MLIHQNADEHRALTLLGALPGNWDPHRDMVSPLEDPRAQGKEIDILILSEVRSPRCYEKSFIRSGHRVGAQRQSGQIFLKESGKPLEISIESSSYKYGY